MNNLESVSYADPNVENSTLISIIIPFKRISLHLKECLHAISLLSYTNFEVILLPDEKFERDEVSIGDLRNIINVIPTGAVLPGEKRNIGIAHSKGSIIAFIDDDACPDRDWLRNALLCFDNPSVAGVGGPNLTHPSDGTRQMAGGIILQSWIGGGGLTYRYRARDLREDDDLPTVNLLIRKDVLDAVGGFDVKYWPGEDTYLCLQITKTLGKKLVYSPDVLVYHHRRPLFIPHLRQIWNYGRHRGHFAKILPQNSRRPLYFAPSLMVVLLAASPLLFVVPSSLSKLYVLGIFIYLVCVIFESLRTKKVELSLMILLGIPLTHITYGIAFIKGLLSPNIHTKIIDTPIVTDHKSRSA